MDFNTYRQRANDDFECVNPACFLPELDHECFGPGCF